MRLIMIAVTATLAIGVAACGQKADKSEGARISTAENSDAVNAAEDMNTAADAANSVTVTDAPPPAK